MQGINKVLLVDDHPPWLNVVAAVVRDWGEGILIEKATTEQGAIEMVHQKGPFDLMILDVNLGEYGSGVEVARAIHDYEARPVIVALSGTTDPVLAFQLGQLGVQAFLRKPASPALLRDTVERAIRDREYVYHEAADSAMVAVG